MEAAPRATTMAWYDMKPPSRLGTWVRHRPSVVTRINVERAHAFLPSRAGVGHTRAARGRAVVLEACLGEHDPTMHVCGLAEGHHAVLRGALDALVLSRVSAPIAGWAHTSIPNSLVVFARHF